jgi:hypothetical protein
MQSRPARLTLSAFAWIALGAAAFFVVQSQRLVDGRRESLRAFELSARDAADALDDAQAGQQAYVALGQEAAKWFPKVSTYLRTATGSIDTLRALALSRPAGPALLDASTAITQFANVDRRVRERIAADELHAAADLVFADGADAVSSAVSNIDAAVSAEQQAADAYEAGQRRLQAYAAGGAVGLAAIVLALFGMMRATSARESAAVFEAQDPEIESLDDLPHATPAVSAILTPATAGPSSVDLLRTLADICTELGRVREASQLKPLLEQAAVAMNARGLIVWLGSTTGADLRPVLAHGYSDETLARIPMLARSADNAAAAAYRTAEVQVLKSRPGATQGTIVAPLLGADGCIGALTAEIRERGEESETTRALALILAAQLSGLLAQAAQEASPDAREARTAAG